MASKKSSNWVSARVACDRLNFRKAPSMSSDVIRILESGASLSIKPDENSEWVRVRVGDDIGFVMKKFVLVARPLHPEVGEDE